MFRTQCVAVLFVAWMLTGETNGQSVAPVIDSTVPGLAPLVTPLPEPVRPRTWTRPVADESGHAADTPAAKSAAEKTGQAAKPDADQASSKASNAAKQAADKASDAKSKKSEDEDAEDEDTDEEKSSDKDKDKDKDKDDAKAEGEKSKASSSQSAGDSQIIARGKTAFDAGCTQCHDADRSTQKKKSKAGWLATVRRMARMDDADIDSADIVPIATYLASLSQPAKSGGSGGQDKGGDAKSDADGDKDAGDEEASADDGGGGGVGSDLNLSGTFSTLFRGGNDNLETPGFFPDIWLTADWQPSGPLRGRVTLCTTCHSDQTDGGGFTFEVVEGAASLDLLYWCKEKDKRPKECRIGIEAELKAGRLVVPFGAFAGISHPGSYRTVSNPLIYAMGRQVMANGSRPPVLPMPYSDEGVDLAVKVPLTEKIDSTLDIYVVNGLQGSGGGVNFTRSRAYVDNNHEPGVGGRATVGTKLLRFGGSVMAGELQDDQTPNRFYNLAGADFTGRFFDNLVRTYFEYAIRRNDTPFTHDQIVYGTVSEIEVLLLEKPNLSGLVRYDTEEYRDRFGDDSVARFTWGFSTTSIGGSLLMLNHERWFFPTPTNDVDVFGVRWVAAF